MTIDIRACKLYAKLITNGIRKKTNIRNASLLKCVEKELETIAYLELAASHAAKRRMTMLRARAAAKKAAMNRLANARTKKRWIPVGRR
jgi:hypothetical protein